MSELTHGYADVGEVTLHYVTAGAGVPVLLVHGFPQTWYAWAQVVPLLQRRGIRCVVPDLRGLGDSTRPAGGYDTKTLAGDLHRLMAGHLGITRYAAVGHDWGGAVAFALAAYHAAEVSCLGVVDVAIPGDGAPDIGQGGRRWHHRFFATLDLPEALIDGREEVLLRWFFENYGHHQGVLAPAAVQEYLRAYRAPGALRAGLGLYRAVARDVADNSALAPLTLPALAVGGGTSWGRGTEVEESLSRMATDVTGLVFDGCGHWVPEEKPRELADALSDFVLAHTR